MRMRLSSPLDDDELFDFCAANRGLRIERTAQGELLITSPTGGRTGKRNLSLSAQFGTWVERDGSGVGFDSSTGFVLPNGAERSPDAAWVRAERWNALSSDEQEKFVPLCPDFVVELRSRSDDLAELKDKMREYIACGAQLGWLLDPKARRVLIYRAGAAEPTIEEADDPPQLSGEPVLKGFFLDLSRVW